MRMTPEDFEAHQRRHGFTPAPQMAVAAPETPVVTSKFISKTEREMHDLFLSWLNLHRDEVYWDHSRMDRPTNNRVGHPDFVLQRAGRALNIELKLPGGTLSDKQELVHAWIVHSGGLVHVCYSAQDAIELTKTEFTL